MSIERLRALEKKWRDELPYKGSAWEERHDIIEEFADELATLIAELGQEVGAVADEYGWVEGPPHRILSKEEGEWFIAETTYGDRVVLKGLPEEYAYDFTTADSTYIKRELIKRWRQFPDSEYKPLGETSPAHTSEARDLTDAKRYRFLREADADAELPYVAIQRIGSWGNWKTDWLMGDEADAAIDAAMSQGGGNG